MTPEADRSQRISAQHLREFQQRLARVGLTINTDSALPVTEQFAALQQAVIDEIGMQRKLFQTIMENAPVGIALLDGPEHRYLIANPTYTMFVAGKGEITGHTVAEVFPEVAETVVPLLDRVYQTGEPFAIADMPMILLRNGRLDETYVSFSYTPWCDEQDHVRGVLVLVQETTGRKQTENELQRLNAELEQRVRERTVALEASTAALRQSEERLRLMVDSVKDYAIFLLDPRGIVISWNIGAERIKGYHADEILGKSFTRFYTPEDIAMGKPERELAQAVANGRFEDEGWRVRKDGTRFWANVIMTPLYMPDGTLLGLVKVTRDISERRRTEEQLQRLNADLEQRTAVLEATNKELEAFSYSVSHDLRAPLRSIDGFSKVLVEQYVEQLDDRGRNYLERVRAAAQRMNRLIDDMLKLSRIGRTEMRHDVVNLSELATAVIDEFRARAPERRVAVEIAPGLRVHGDAALLRIVLENLLGNAWKFTSHRADARIVFGTAMQDDEPVYYVRDNGAGFDMSYADKLFTPFQRLHTEQEFPGTGIGLAIVQRIIARHGGRVWAEGAEGAGATIYFTLDEARGDAQDAAGS